MNIKAILLAAALMVVFIVGLAAATHQKSPIEPVRLYTSSGTLFDSSEHAGKVMVIDFFATWCPPCRAAIPALQTLHERYKDRGVIVLSVQVSDDQSPDELMNKLGVRYPVLIDGDQLAQSFDVKGLPTLVVINKQGVESHRSTGWGGNSQQQIADAIEEALAAE